jgi:hypothetical protein
MKYKVSKSGEVILANYSEVPRLNLTKFAVAINQTPFF